MVTKAKVLVKLLSRLLATHHTLIFCSQISCHKTYTPASESLPIHPLRPGNLSRATMSSEAYLKEQIISKCLTHNTLRDRQILPSTLAAGSLTRSAGEARAQYGLYITQELVKDRPAKLDVIFRRYEVDEYEIVYRAWVIVYLDLEMSKWYLLKIGDCHDESRKLALENLLDTLIDQAEVKRSKLLLGTWLRRRSKAVGVFANCAARVYGRKRD